MPTGWVSIHTTDKTLAASLDRFEVALVRPDGLIVKVRATGKQFPVPTGKYHVRAVSSVFEAGSNSKPWYFSFFATIPSADGPMYEVGPGNLVNIPVLEGFQFESGLVEGPFQCHLGDDLNVIARLTCADGLRLGHFCRHEKRDGVCSEGPDISLVASDGTVLATGEPFG